MGSHGCGLRETSKFYHEGNIFVEREGITLALTTAYNDANMNTNNMHDKTSRKVSSGELCPSLTSDQDISADLEIFY